MLGLKRFAALALLLFPAVAHGQLPWDQFRGPLRNNLSQDTGLLDSWATPPQLLWKVEGIGLGMSGLSVNHGVLCTMVEDGDDLGIIGIDAATGKRLWRTRLREEKKSHFMPGSTPIVNGDFIYAVLPESAIFCLRTATGELLWRRSFDDFGGRRPMHGYRESPLIDGDRVVFTPHGVDAGIVALDKLTGKEMWRCPIKINGEPLADGAECYSSIMISEGGDVKQYVQVFRDGTVGVDPETGKQLWSHPRPVAALKSISSPLVQGDHVLTTSGHGTQSVLLKLSRSDSGVDVKEIYASEPGFVSNFGGLILDDYIYSQGNGIAVRELLTGKLLETPPPPASLTGRGPFNFIYADGHFYCHYGNSTVALFSADPKKLELKGQFQTAQRPDERMSYIAMSDMASPTISQGRLYVREQGTIYCYALQPDAAPQANTPVATTDVALLIKQLGDDDYRTRENGATGLVLFGRPAISPLEKAAKSSEDYEVRARAEKLLAKLRNMTPEQHALQIELDKFIHAEIGTETSLPGWQKFESLVGDSRESRQLFFETQQGAAPLLAAYEKGPDSLASQFAEHVIKCRSEGIDNNFSYYPPYWVGSLGALLFVAGDDKTSLPDGSLTELLSLVKAEPFLAASQSDPGLQKLVEKWLSKPSATLASASLYDKLEIAFSSGNSAAGVAIAASNLEAIPLEKRKKIENPGDGVVLQSIAAIAQGKDMKYLPLVETFLEDTTPLGEKSQFRDCILAMLVQMADEDLEQYGFKPMGNFGASDGGWLRINWFVGYQGFPDDAARQKSLDKWAEVSKKLKQSVKK